MESNESTVRESTTADNKVVAPTELTISAEMPGNAESNIGLELQTENLIETYQVMADWIRFADAKAGVVLTVGGAFGGLLIPTMRTFLAAQPSDATDYWWPWLVLGLSSACLLLLVIAFFFAFLCLTPFRIKGKHPAAQTCPHFHSVGIAGKYRIDQLNEFIQGYQQAQRAGFQRELLAALLIDSHISVTKYKNVSRSIRCVAFASLFGLAYLVAAQF